MVAFASRVPMRIGMLTTSYPRYSGDPSGCFVRDFAKSLAKRGHAVEVLVPDADDCNEDAADTQLSIARIPVRYAWPRKSQRLFYGAGVPDNLAQSPWLAPQLVSYAACLYGEAWRRAKRWDAVISHWALPCGLVASMLPRRLPHLAVCHSADVHALTTMPLGASLRRFLRRRASAMWFVAPSHRDRFMAGGQFSDAVYTGPMGFSPVIHGTVPTTYRVQEKRRYLRAVTLSRLVRVKGLSTAIDAITAMEDVELVIAGDGPERERLQEQARGCSRIHFVGPLSGAAKAKHLVEADVFLLPSHRLPSGRSEGVPCALLEAMHMELPVIASDVGGVSSVVDHERTGLLVAAGDVDALRLSLRRIGDDPALAARLGNAAKLAVEPHAWGTLGERIEALLFRPPTAAVSCSRER